MACIQNLRFAVVLGSATLVEIRKPMNLRHSEIRLNVVVVVGVRLYLGALWLGGNG